MPPDAHSNTSIRLAAAIAGDQGSLGWLVAHLSPLLLAQARWRLGAALRRAYEPEDLVQEAWLVALPRLAQLEPRDGRTTPVLLRFLATTIVHRVNNLAREALRRGEGDADASAGGSAAVSADQTGVITAAVRSEMRHALLAAIDALDPIDRDVLLLRGVEQRSLQTTAELLGVTTDAVSMRFTRALGRLRGHLPAALADDLGG